MIIQPNWNVAILRKEAETWRAKAADRRALTPNDQVADAIDALAARLEEVASNLEKDSEMISAEEFAELCGKSPQIVRAWCRKGELRSVRSHGKYWIPRRAKREKAS